MSVGHLTFSLLPLYLHSASHTFSLILLISYSGRRWMEGLQISQGDSNIPPTGFLSYLSPTWRQISLFPSIPTHCIIISLLSRPAEKYSQRRGETQNLSLLPSLRRQQTNIYHHCLTGRWKTPAAGCGHASTHPTLHTRNNVG